MRKSSYLLNDLRNYKETFRKDVGYDNIKSYEKSGVSLSVSLGNTFLEKPQEIGSQTDLPRSLFKVKNNLKFVAIENN